MMSMDFIHETGDADEYEISLMEQLSDGLI